MLGNGEVWQVGEEDRIESVLVAGGKGGTLFRIFKRPKSTQRHRTTISREQKAPSY
jgi:hypothetical protein